MKISLFKFYKTSILVFLMLGLAIIIGSFVFSLCFQMGYIVVLLGSFVGTLCALFPILLNYRQLTYVIFKNDECISYSFLHKKLCAINIREKIYYSVFYVRFAYAPQIQFIALSNESFKISKSPKRLLNKSFFGYYDQKKIIVLPYDEQVSLLLQERTKIIANTNNTGDGSMC